VEGCWFSVEVFNERNVKRVENAVTGGVPQPVGFCVRTVTDHYAGKGAREKFGVVGVDERIGTAPDFTEVGKGRETFEPELIRRSAMKGSGWGEVCEKSGSCRELVPHGWWGLAGKAHCSCFFNKGAV
jgi:hypothetical protein